MSLCKPHCGTGSRPKPKGDGIELAPRVPSNRRSLGTRTDAPVARMPKNVKSSGNRTSHPSNALIPSAKHTSRQSNLLAPPASHPSRQPGASKTPSLVSAYGSDIFDPWPNIPSQPEVYDGSTEGLGTPVMRSSSRVSGQSVGHASVEGDSQVSLPGRKAEDMSTAALQKVLDKLENQYRYGKF